MPSCPRRQTVQTALLSGLATCLPALAAARYRRRRDGVLHEDPVATGLGFSRQRQAGPADGRRAACGLIIKSQSGRPWEINHRFIHPVSPQAKSILLLGKSILNCPASGGFLAGGCVLLPIWAILGLKLGPHTPPKGPRNGPEMCPQKTEFGLRNAAVRAFLTAWAQTQLVSACSE